MKKIIIFGLLIIMGTSFLILKTSHRIAPPLYQAKTLSARDIDNYLSLVKNTNEKNSRDSDHRDDVLLPSGVLGYDFRNHQPVEIWRACGANYEILNPVADQKTKDEFFSHTSCTLTLIYPRDYKAFPDFSEFEKYCKKIGGVLVPGNGFQTNQVCSVSQP
jgi:hypothetical protein